MKQKAPAVGAAALAPVLTTPFPGLTPPSPPVTSPTSTSEASAAPPTDDPPPPSFLAGGDGGAATTPSSTSSSPPSYSFGSFATSTVAAARVVGATLAARATAAGVEGVVWKTHPPPRYHGKVKAVVDALAAGGVTVYTRGEPAGGAMPAHAPPAREEAPSS